MYSKSLFAPILLIAIGVFFLLQNFGLLPQLGPLIARWWPLVLIIVGVVLLFRRSR